MMKKILIFILFTFYFGNASGQEEIRCAALDPSIGLLKKIEPFENLSAKIKETFQLEIDNKIKYCRENVFAKIADKNFNMVHNKNRCAAVQSCIDNNNLFSTQKDKKSNKIDQKVDELIANAALVSAIENEIKNPLKYEYTISLNQYEKEHGEQLCPASQLDSKCEKKILNVLSLVRGHLIGFPSFTKEKKSQTTEDYFSEIFFPIDKVSNISKSKNELKLGCINKIKLSSICSEAERSKYEKIQCERSKDKNCLKNDQNALASLLESEKSNQVNFLEIERQLCSEQYLVFEPEFSENFKMAIWAATNGLVDLPKKNNDSFIPADFSKTISKPTIASKPIVATEPSAKIEESKIVPAKSNEASSAEANINSSLNHGYYPSNNSFSSNANVIAEEEFKKNIERENAITKESIVSAAKSKNEDLNALTNKINTMKSKLEELNAVADDLKIKNESSKNEINNLKNENNISDLKNKIAELEKEKKIMQVESVAKTSNVGNVNIKPESLNENAINEFSAIANHAVSNQTEVVNRSNEKSVIDSTPSPRNTNDNTTSVMGKSSEGSANTATGITLRGLVAGAQATPDSSVVYMTAVELQKYPFHLNDNASPYEIDKMLLSSKGASIIVGNDEQLIPILLNGVVQLDEKGLVKYKRVKITLVKNDKDRKQSIKREISSVADLNREDQNKRKLIRYQEMKDVINNATK